MVLLRTLCAFSLKLLILRSEIGFKQENEGQIVSMEYYNNQTTTQLINLLNNMNISANNNAFESIKSIGSGGSLRYSSPVTSFELKNNSFANSSSTGHGGSVYFYGLTNLFVKNCSFMTSSAPSYGGTGYFYSTNAIIEDITIQNSSSGYYGGALYLQGTKHVLSNISITNSSSNSYGGGAIYMSLSSFSLYSSRIELSQTKSLSLCGGAIFSENINTLFEIVGSIFIHISATSHGGAICLIPSGHFPINIKESTFVNCTSYNGNGGSIYISTPYGYNLQIEIMKICASQCKIATSSTELGHFLYIDSSTEVNSNTAISYVSMNYCGEITQGISNIYLFESLLNLLNTNESFCKSLKSSGLYLIPSRTLSCHFNTFFNNTSSDFDFIYIQGPATVYSASIQNSNFIRNQCLASIINITTYGSRLTIQECIFINNTGSILFKSNIANILVKNCYIYHLTTVGVSVTFESTKTTTVNTQTYQLSHYSTVFCSTPEDMGQLELPCQTIPPPPTAVNDPQECITLPATQTNCIIESGGNLTLLSHILGILQSAILLISISQ